MRKIKENFYLNLICSKGLLKTMGIAAFIIALALGIFAWWWHLGNNGSSFSLVSIVYGFMYIVIILLSLGGPKGNFTFSLRNGSTRRDYFWGIMSFYICISAVFSITFTLLFILEKLSFNYLGLNQIINFSFIFKTLNVLSALRLILYLFLLMFAVSTFINMIAFIAYKIGQYGWIVIIGAVVTSLKGFPMCIEFLIKISPTDFNYNIIDLIIILISVVASYFVIIKTEIRNV